MAHSSGRRRPTGAAWIAAAGIACPVLAQVTVPRFADRTLQGELAGERFGSGVAGIGDITPQLGDGRDDVIISAPNQNQVGHVRVHISPGPPVFEFVGTVPGGSGRNLGYTRAVDGAGDVNGDGWPDIIMGEHQFVRDLDGAAVKTGAAYVYSGNPLEPGAPRLLFTLLGDEGFAQFGFSVAGLGDINSDGFDDVLVGARMSTRGGCIPQKPCEGELCCAFVSQSGAAYVFLGFDPGAGGPVEREAALADYIFAGQPTDNLGYALDTAGDFFNFAKNPTPDIVLGGAYAQGALDGIQTGRSYVVFTENLPAPSPGLELRIGDNYTPDVTVLGHSLGYLGYAVAGGGDFNGDGHDDVLLGAWEWDPEGQLHNADQGRVFVLFGEDSLVPATWHASAVTESPLAFEWITGEDLGHKFGTDVAFLPDINDDGRDEIIIGAPLWPAEPVECPGYPIDLPRNEVGRVYTFLGNATGVPDLATQADAKLDGEVPDPCNEAFLDIYGGKFGYSIDSAGDINGDGRLDLIVGAPDWDNATSPIGVGRAYIFFSRIPNAVAH